MYICAWFGLVIALLIAFLRNAYGNVYEKGILINNDYLPILVLLYIMLCIIIAYLMLFAGLCNAVCILRIFLPLIFANAFCFHALSWIIDTFCLFKILFCIMYSCFNLLVFLILC